MDAPVTVIQRRVKNFAIAFINRVKHLTNAWKNIIKRSLRERISSYKIFEILINAVVNVTFSLARFKATVVFVLSLLLIFDVKTSPPRCMYKYFYINTNGGFLKVF